MQKLPLIVLLALVLSFFVSPPQSAEAEPQFSDYYAARTQHIVSYPLFLGGGGLAAGMIALAYSGFDDGEFGSVVGAIFATLVAIPAGICGLVGVPVHLASSLKGATSLQLYGMNVSPVLAYLGWGALAQGIIVPILYYYLDKEKKKDHLLFAAWYGGASILAAMTFSLAQWIVNGSKFNNRAEPVSLKPFQVQFSARF